MKVLLFEWPSVTNREMADMLVRAGCEVHVLRLPFNSFSGDKKLLEEFEPYLEKDTFDFVFSINYFDMIAEACYRKRVKYIAWAYDSPTHMGDLKILSHDTNYVFLFDRTEAEKYRKQGFENVYHLPLAVDCDRYDTVRARTKKNMRIIQSDISFVGRLYENNMAEITAHLPDYYKAFLNALVDEQLLLSGYNILDDTITPELMWKMSNPEFNRLLNTPKKLPWAQKEEEQEAGKKKEEGKQKEAEREAGKQKEEGEREADKKREETRKKEEEEKKKALEAIPNPGTLAFKLKEVVTNRERLLVLQLLARHHHLKLFSDQKSSVIKNAYMCGTVDYYTNMPKVFKYSKINMNISLRCIESGIPLRCLDIMGCGGLLMSNYQREFDDHFVNGRDLLIYSCPEDALEKANYYLNPRHETERKKIAQNGYEIVRKYYSYQRQFAYIWEKAKLGKPDWKG